MKQSLNGTDATPIIMDPTTGRMATRRDAPNIYVRQGLFPSKTKAAEGYDASFPAPRPADGAFMDQQQAAKCLEIALNSTEDQAKLGLMDGGSKREFFTVSVMGLVIAGRTEPREMYAARADAGRADMSDLTHLADFTSVIVGLDSMAPDGVHRQTLYPVN